MPRTVPTERIRKISDVAAAWSVESTSVCFRSYEELTCTCTTEDVQQRRDEEYSHPHMDPDQAPDEPQLALSLPVFVRENEHGDGPSEEH